MTGRLRRRCLCLVLASAISCRWGREGVRALQGTRYAAAQEIVETYCGPCHTRRGRHPEHARAYADLQLDTYQQLRARPFLVQSALTVHGERADMPPSFAPRQPSAEQRALLIDWLHRGAPNTPDGRAVAGAGGSADPVP